MSRRRIAALPWALLVLLARPARPARACDVACLTGYMAPAAGLALPSNAPGLVYVPPQVARPGDPNAGLQILGPDGGEVAFALQPLPGEGRREYLVVAPLVPGAYRLKAVRGCTIEGAAAATDSDFTVGGPAPLPATLGRVTAGASQRVHLTVPDDGSCTRDVEAGRVPLTVTPSDVLRPYLPVASFTLTIDGQPWTRTPYGAGWNASDDPYTVCSAEKPAGVRLLSPGRHTAVLSVAIAGASSAPPPVAVELFLACDPSVRGAGLADPAPGSASGCSLMPRTSWGPWSPVALAAAVLLLRRRREKAGNPRR